MTFEGNRHLFFVADHLFFVKIYEKIQKELAIFLLYLRNN